MTKILIRAEVTFYLKLGINKSIADAFYIDSAVHPNSTEMVIFVGKTIGDTRIGRTRGTSLCKSIRNSQFCCKPREGPFVF